jgi:hypothetical protein
MRNCLQGCPGEGGAMRWLAMWEEYSQLMIFAGRRECQRTRALTRWLNRWSPAYARVLLLHGPGVARSADLVRDRSRRPGFIPWTVKLPTGYSLSPTPTCASTTRPGLRTAAGCCSTARRHAAGTSGCWRSPSSGSPKLPELSHPISEPGQRSRHEMQTPAFSAGRSGTVCRVRRGRPAQSCRPKPTWPRAASRPTSCLPEERGGADPGRLPRDYRSKFAARTLALRESPL